MNSNNVTISVIIPSLNGEKFLRKCISSLCAKGERDFEIIVVENGSIDKSRDLLYSLQKRFRQLKIVVLPKNVGSALAINIGVSNSVGKYLFVVNNDIIIKPGWSSQIKSFFSKYKKVGVAQGKILKHGTNNYDYAGDFLGPFGFLIERARGARDIGQFDTVEQIFSMKETAMFMRRDVFEKLKGFDGDYIFALEETDFTWRVWLAGYEVLYCPEIVVWHAYGTKLKKMDYYINNRIYYLGCRNTIMTIFKNIGFKRMLFMLPLNIACWFTLAIAFLLKGETRKSLDLFSGILWNLVHIETLIHKRSVVQRGRKVSDDEIFSMVGRTQPIGYYIGKGVSYIVGKPF
jgi:GT2 family glycosyltransferase